MGQTDRSGYRPWDRDEKLGAPPWMPDDPKVVAWEQAHGHDVRLKCYPEFGCHLREDAIELAAREVVALGYQCEAHSPLADAIDRLMEALDA